MKKIDVYPHILPEKYFKALSEKAPSQFYMAKRWKEIPCLLDLNKRMEIMDQFEDYTQILTPSSPPLERVVNSKVSPELARIANDEMANIVHKHPGRFPAGVAMLPMNNIDASIQELDRSIRELNLKGVLIYTNINGQPLDKPEFSFLFQKMAEYDLPIWLHPARGTAFSDYEQEKSSRYDIWFCFGWPYETSAAMTRIVFSGVFDAYPNLKIITHHLGGMAPYFDERIRGTYDQFGKRSDEDTAPMTKLKKHPLDYFKMFYADTAVYGSVPAMQCGLSFFGPDRVLFGSDMPFDEEKGPKYIRTSIESMESISVSAKDKQKIYEDNIKNMLSI